MLSFKRAYDVLFLVMVMFPHELKIQAFLIIYCHWEMFWLASHDVATPVLKHSPILLYVHTGPIPFRAVMWKADYDDDSFIKDSFNYSQIRSREYPGEAAVLQWRWAIRSETHIKSQTTLRSPRLSIHVNGISIFTAHTKEISTQMVCQRWPNKPVYVLNAMGTFDIPHRHCHRQVITAITPPH